MLRKVEKKYVDDITAMLKKWVDTEYQEDIQADIENGLANFDRELHDFGLWAKADITRLPDGTPEKTPDGRYVLENFIVGGDMLLFYAFCLQEGELKIAEFYQTDENREHYSGETAHMYIGDSDDSGVRTDCDCSIREWREYIRDKYRIMPPALGNAFVGLTRNFFYLTGGLAFAECPNEAEREIE
ncbi:MAG: hypothetical protein LBR74_04675 [Eubacterium sp.]|jgi:hypothetical protein|nr:hypothetical protein [Eubacterium sp.]